MPCLRGITLCFKSGWVTLNCLRHLPKTCSLTKGCQLTCRDENVNPVKKNSIMNACHVPSTMLSFDFQWTAVSPCLTSGNPRLFNVIESHQLVAFIKNTNLYLTHILPINKFIQPFCCA